jgi:hypothetical protein
MISYAEVGLTHAELLLVTCLKRKTLRGIKTSSCQCVIHRVLSEHGINITTFLEKQT